MHTRRAYRKCATWVLCACVGRGLRQRCRVRAHLEGSSAGSSRKFLFQPQPACGFLPPSASDALSQPAAFLEGERSRSCYHVHRHRLRHTIFIALPQTRSTRHVDAPHALTHTSMCRNRGTRAVSGQFTHVCTRSGRSQGGGHACAGLGQPARSYVRVLRTLAARLGPFLGAGLGARLAFL